jgi:hypothetical protein
MTHHKVDSHVHYSTGKALGTEMTDGEHTHTHTQKPLCEHEDMSVVWNHGVHTDREVTADRPHIIIKNKKIFILTDVARPGDRNVMQKEAEKKLKYKSLCEEIQ